MIGLVALAALWLREAPAEAGPSERSEQAPSHLLAECACAR